jgi:putative PIN family toxin of toxin-antitoxin system
MAADRRTVLDTNVIVSGLLLPCSIPRQALDHALATGSILVSAATIAELDEVLRRPKFDPYLTEEDRLAFLVGLVRDAEVVEVDFVVTDCRDPKGNRFLELAISGKATHLVTGDDDLLILHPFHGTAIVTPCVFLGEG